MAKFHDKLKDLVMKVMIWKCI